MKPTQLFIWFVMFYIIAVICTAQTTPQAPAPVPKIALPSIASPSTPTMDDLARKYGRLFDTVTPKSRLASVQFIRRDIETDLKRFQAIADTSLVNKSPGKGVWNEVIAARAIVKWLSGPVTQALAKLEQSAAPTP
jgi:hypothetical protein